MAPDAFKLAVLRQYIHMQPVKDWLHRMYSKYGGNGPDLVDALGDSGVTNNCYTADRVLDVLVDEGWITPLKYAPSLTQVHCGAGGRAPGTKFRKPVKWRYQHTCAQEWSYLPNLESPAFMEYLGVSSSTDNTQGDTDDDSTSQHTQEDRAGCGQDQA